MSCVTGMMLLSPAVCAQGTADTYPAKPVRVVVGLAPGGGTDIQARLLAQKLGSNLNRSFIVDNRPGAGGTVAYAAVTKSPPDGYTLLAVASGYSITPAVYAKLPYDPVNDFALISLVVRAPIMLMTHPALPVRSAKELVALAKAKPGALDAASAGHGTSNHLALELFNQMAGIRIAHVPYKGTGPALIDGMAGQVHMLFGNVLSSLQYVRQKRLNALAVTSLTRSVVMPDIPTLNESAVPGYETTTWHGWLAPAGTPAAIVNRLRAELVKAVKSSDVLDNLAADGGEPVGSTPEEFRTHLVAEIARWRKVVQVAGIRVN